MLAETVEIARKAVKERDDLRRQLRDIRAIHEGLHRVLYPLQYTKGQVDEASASDTGD